MVCWVYLKTKARNHWSMGSMVGSMLVYGFYVLLVEQSSTSNKIMLLFSEWAKESRCRKAEEWSVVSFSLKQ